MESDQFGHDPQVRFLRRAFANMEATQDSLLKTLNISPFDGRLGRIRVTALKLFEKVWMVYDRWGSSADEKEMADIYIHCLARILNASRIVIPAGVLSANEKIENIIREVSK